MLWIENIVPVPVDFAQSDHCSVVVPRLLGGKDLRNARGSFWSLFMAE